MSDNWQKLCHLLQALKDPIVFYTNPPPELVSCPIKQLIEAKSEVKALICPKLNLRENEFLPTK
jgi:hypothetical protein